MATVKEMPQPRNHQLVSWALKNDQLQLNGLRVYDGAKGLFVSYPNDVSRKGEEYHQIYHPVSSELRASIEKTVLEEYQAAIAG